MINSLLDVLNYRTGASTFGIEIKFDLPMTDLREFKITMSNSFSKTERWGSDIITRIEKNKSKMFYDDIGTQLEKEGYWVEPGDEREIGTCPTLYATEKEALKEYPTLDVYMHPQEFSGVAPIKDIDIIYSILRKSKYVSNLSIEYIQPVYDLSMEVYQEIIKKEQVAIEKWIKQYLVRGFSEEKAGRNFHKTYGICLLSEAGDRAFSGMETDIPYIKELAQKINRELWINRWNKPHPKRDKNQCSIDEANYAFKCSICGSLVTKKRKCDFVNRYIEYSCKCGGEFVRVK